MAANRDKPELTDRLLMIGRQIIELAENNNSSVGRTGTGQTSKDAEVSRIRRIEENASELRLIACDRVGEAEQPSAFNFEASKLENGLPITDGTSARVSKAFLPNPQRIRALIKMRQLRRSYFDDDLFADPAWDMLLDLIAARSEFRQISVTSLCIASGVAPTTALRWIRMMIEKGYFERRDDDRDKRRAFVALSEKGAVAAAQYFSRVESEQAGLI